MLVCDVCVTPIEDPAPKLCSSCGAPLALATRRLDAEPASVGAATGDVSYSGSNSFPADTRSEAKLDQPFGPEGAQVAEADEYLESGVTDAPRVVADPVSIVDDVEVDDEEEVDEAVKGLSSLMEPFIIVILGTLIGGIVVSMYLPIFKLGQVV